MDAPLQLDQDPFLTALRDGQATSPSSAIVLEKLPSISVDRLSVFRDSGIVRRIAAGSYYLPTRLDRADPTRATFTPTRVALMTGFWLAAILVPLAVFLLTR